MYIFFYLNVHIFIIYLPSSDTRNKYFQNYLHIGLLHEQKNICYIPSRPTKRHQNIYVV